MGDKTSGTGIYGIPSAASFISIATPASQGTYSAYSELITSTGSSIYILEVIVYTPAGSATYELTLATGAAGLEAPFAAIKVPGSSALQHRARSLKIPIPTATRLAVKIVNYTDSVARSGILVGLQVIAQSEVVDDGVAGTASIAAGGISASTFAANALGAMWNELIGAHRVPGSFGERFVTTDQLGAESDAIHRHMELLTQAFDSGTLASATSTSATLPSTHLFDADELQGKIIVIMTGTSAGSKALITGNTAAPSCVLALGAWTSGTPDGTSTYVII